MYDSYNLQWNQQRRYYLTDSDFTNKLPNKRLHPRGLRSRGIFEKFDPTNAIKCRQFRREKTCFLCI